MTLEGGVDLVPRALLALPSLASPGGEPHIPEVVVAAQL
jgi:hypothetical protein